MSICVITDFLRNHPQILHINDVPEDEDLDDGEEGGFVDGDSATRAGPDASCLRLAPHSLLPLQARARQPGACAGAATDQR